MSITTTHFGNNMTSREMAADGDKVLWIHGYTMDSSLWEPLWRQLPQWHHIGIDLPYHGQSGGMPHATMPDFVRLVGNLALEKGVRHIAGLSLGAVITLQLATEFPDTFDSVLLGSAGINHAPNDRHAGPRYRQLGQLYYQRGAGPWMTELWMQSPPDIFKGAAKQEALRGEIAAVIDRHKWEEFGNGFIGTLTEYRQIDHMDAIARIQSPTLLVVGEEEMPTFKDCASMLETTIPNCTVVYLPDVGHLCLLENPVDSARHIAAHWQQAKVVRA